MKKNAIKLPAFIAIFAILVSLFSAPVHSAVTWTGNEWNLVSEQQYADINNLRAGREDARSSFFPFKTQEDALASQQPGRERDLSAALFQSLDSKDGQSWKFYYVTYPGARQSRPDNANIMNPDYDDSQWDEIEVPKSWEAIYNEDMSFKYSWPHYSNVAYPWGAQNPNPIAPNAPTQYNPVGVYRTKIDVDPVLQGKSIFLNFEGVESFLYLWVNGQQVGYSHDSFTSKEFKIDEYLNYDGNDTLAVEVFKWSSASWMEDQDMLRLAGIFRDVYLIGKEKVEIRDFTINTTKAGSGIDPDVDYEDFNFELYANIRDLGAAEKDGLKVDVALYDADGQILPEDMLESKDFAKTLNASDFTQTDSMGRASKTVKLSAKVKSPEKWSAESPSLYKALVTLRDAQNNIIETTAYRFGFRTIEMKNKDTADAQMIINGQPLLIKGVNTHENNPTSGRTLNYELIYNDLILMKQYNFNSIRMSHYSHDFDYYDIADELGIYICDETNMETHGNTSIPSNNNNYREAALDRISSMFYRSKNFPSVIIHSLGNEAGRGTVFADMASWLKGSYTGAPSFYVDATLKGDLHARPIHYEGDNSKADIKSNMYSPYWDIENNAKENKPYVLCEYSHSMGNSGGYYQDYWDAFESRANIQGGWIWDWVDQSIMTYVDPAAFPPQNSLGWSDGWIVSQDKYATKMKANGPESLSFAGHTGASGDIALKGAAYAELTPEELNFNGSHTIEAWVYPQSNDTSSRVIVAKGDRQYQLKTVNGSIQFNTYKDGWNELNYPLPAGTWIGNWHHIVITYDASTKIATLYLDDMSVPVKTQEFSRANADGTFAKSGQNFSIGRDLDKGVNTDWLGLIDDVHVYDKALTQAEIADTARSASDENVVFWQSFDGELERDAVDTSLSVYSIISQDAYATTSTLTKRNVALEETGVSGEVSDKALYGAAVVQKTPQALNLNGAMTLEAWVKPTSTAGIQTIIGKGDSQFVLRLQQNDKLLFQTYCNTPSGSWNQLLYTIDTADWVGKWQHVAVTYDPQTRLASLYLNDMSEPVQTQTFTNVNANGTFNSNSSEFAVGRDTENAGSRDWTGYIDDAHVYNRVLTSDELSDTGRSVSDDGVVYWQDFNTSAIKEIPTVTGGYLGYGGDWGDSPNDSNFSGNGVIGADRTPRGAMQEIKRVHQDYVFTPVSFGSDSAKVNIRSRALFTNADAYDFVWALKENGQTIREGSDSLDIAPLESKDITLSFDAIELIPGREYFLTMKFLLKESKAWADAGHEISAGQIELSGVGEAEKLSLAGVPVITSEETDEEYIISGSDFTLRFDRAMGTISSLIYKDTELFAQDALNGPAPNFWRAPTDDDRLSGISSDWRFAGANRDAVVTSMEQINSRAVKISVAGDLQPASGSATYAADFTILGNGEIIVENKMTPSGFESSSLIPAVGTTMQLAQGLDNLTWFGRGSDDAGMFSESYVDRYKQQFVDVYTGKVQDQHIEYLRPQTTGNKMDMRWVALTNEDGIGLLASAVGCTLNFNAQQYSQEELTGKNHPYELTATGNTVLNLDYRHMGVGYDPGWLRKGWYKEEHMIRPTQAFEYTYKLTPISSLELSDTFETYSRSYSMEEVPEEPVIVGIDVAANPSKTVYYVDDVLKLDGLVATFVYDDESTFNVPYAAFEEYGIAVFYEDGTPVQDGDILTLEQHGTRLMLSFEGMYAYTGALTVQEQDGEDIPVSKIKINASGLFTLSVKKTAQIPVSIEPENATDPSVQWISTNPNIFTVDDDGMLTPHKQGTATLTAQSSNGLKSTIIVRITA